MTRDELNMRYPWMRDTELFQHANGGGWVEHPERVDPKAYLSGNALVYGNAQVYGNALVSGDALVYGDARVYGNAQVERTPWMLSLGRHTITKCDNDVITIGCHCNTLAWWLEHYPAVGRREGYSADEVGRYGSALKLIAQLTAKR